MHNISLLFNKVIPKQNAEHKFTIQQSYTKVKCRT